MIEGTYEEHLVSGICIIFGIEDAIVTDECLPDQESGYVSTFLQAAKEESKKEAQVTVAII